MSIIDNIGYQLKFYLVPRSLQYASKMELAQFDLLRLICVPKIKHCL